MNQTPAHYMLHLLVIKEGAIYCFIFGVRNIINAGKKRNLCQIRMNACVYSCMNKYLPHRSFELVGIF